MTDTRYIHLDPKAQKAYDTMEKERILEVPEGELDAGSAAVLGNKLLQLASGAVYMTETMQTGKEVRQEIEIHNCKLEAFGELVESLQGQHMHVFYNFQHDRHRILKFLEKSGLRIGELKSSDDIAKWNAGEMDMLLAHPASAAYGLNLQDGGNHVIWFGLNWSLELYDQANARLFRQGQKKTVFIHRLAVVGSVDEDVLASLEEKGNHQKALLSALKTRVEKYKQEVRR